MRKYLNESRKFEEKAKKRQRRASQAGQRLVLEAKKIMAEKGYGYKAAFELARLRLPEDDRLYQVGREVKKGVRQYA